MPGSWRSRWPRSARAGRIRADGEPVPGALRRGVEGTSRAAALAVSGGWVLVIVADLVIVPLVPRSAVVPWLGAGTTLGLTGSGVALLFLVRRFRGRDALAGCARASLAGLAGAAAGTAAGLARINALLHHVEARVDVRAGDLFAPVRGERFDLVLFNPPYYRGRPRDLFDHAWRAEDVVERFAAGLWNALTPGGQALVVLSSDGDSAAFLAAFRANALAIETVVRRDHGNETLIVYSLRPAEGGLRPGAGVADAARDGEDANAQPRPAAGGTVR